MRPIAAIKLHTVIRLPYFPAQTVRTWRGILIAKCFRDVSYCSNACHQAHIGLP